MQQDVHGTKQSSYHRTCERNTQKTTKTPEVSVSGEIQYTAHELGLIHTVISVRSLEKNSQGYQEEFIPEKADQLTAYEIFRDLKKCIDDKNNFIAGKVTFGTAQKSFILKRLEDFGLPVTMLEYKFSLQEKLK